MGNLFGNARVLKQELVEEKGIIELKQFINILNIDIFDNYSHWKAHNGTIYQMDLYDILLNFLLYSINHTFIIINNIPISSKFVYIEYIYIFLLKKNKENFESTK